MGSVNIFEESSSCSSLCWECSSWNGIPDFIGETRIQGKKPRCDTWRTSRGKVPHILFNVLNCNAIHAGLLKQKKGFYKKVLGTTQDVLDRGGWLKSRTCGSGVALMRHHCSLALVMLRTGHQTLHSHQGRAGYLLHVLARCQLHSPLHLASSLLTESSFHMRLSDLS